MIILTKVLIWMIIDYVKDMFHRCNFEVISERDTEKGSIWYESCSVCGKERTVLFNSDNDCVGIIDK